MKKKTEEQSKQEIKASDTRLYQWGYNQAMEDVRVKFAKIFSYEDSKNRDYFISRFTEFLYIQK